jgi:hypothetical protein
MIVAATTSRTGGPYARRLARAEVAAGPVT